MEHNALGPVAALRKHRGMLFLSVMVRSKLLAVLR